MTITQEQAKEIIKNRGIYPTKLPFLRYLPIRMAMAAGMANIKAISIIKMKIPFIWDSLFFFSSSIFIKNYTRIIPESTLRYRVAFVLIV